VPVILALDVGEKRIGVAVGSTESGLARPHDVWQVTTTEKVTKRIRELAMELGATALVVGVPLNADGSLSDQSMRIKRYIEGMAEDIGLPIVFWDEAYSTQEAQARLLEAQRGRRRRRQREDAAAAAVILQNYLDSQR